MNSGSNKKNKLKSEQTQVISLSNISYLQI